MGCCSLLPLWFGPYVGLSLSNIHWVFANTRGVDIKSVCRWSNYPNSIKLPQTRTIAVYGAYDYSSTGTAVSPGILACTVQNVSSFAMIFRQPNKTEWLSKIPSDLAHKFRGNESCSSSRSSRFLQCRHFIPTLNAWPTRSEYTTARPIVIQFPGHGCIDDIKS